MIFLFESKFPAEEILYMKDTRTNTYFSDRYYQKVRPLATISNIN